MWIFKGIVIIICIILSIVSAILFFIPSILMWDFDASNPCFEGIWKVYTNFFERFEK